MLATSVKASSEAAGAPAQTRDTSSDQWAYGPVLGWAHGRGMAGEVWSLRTLIGSRRRRCASRAAAVAALSPLAAIAPRAAQLAAPLATRLAAPLVPIHAPAAAARGRRPRLPLRRRLAPRPRRQPGRAAALVHAIGRRHR